jgi:hypothetical protein
LMIRLQYGLEDPGYRTEKPPFPGAFS